MDMITAQALPFTRPRMKVMHTAQKANRTDNASSHFLTDILHLPSEPWAGIGLEIELVALIESVDSLDLIQSQSEIEDVRVLADP